ncbi:hypothetical protein MCUN1_003794 [Malassezia cuniculi]|uniref:Fungal lipase-type domain-containing protein n=1 Tax=Malassezia cuniculi TaxID=948313 RepID=A0AAF0ETQ1_9BASI|nr:hypothetical protein MCUN1_003794 [Malassezia cuniculi]
MKISLALVGAAIAGAAAAASVNMTASGSVMRSVKLDKLASERTSSETPTKNLPIDWHLLSQAGGLAQEPYCMLQPVGLQVGDSVLLWKSENANNQSRVSVFKSDSLGIVLSIQGTDVGSLNGYLHDIDFGRTDPDATFDGILPAGVKLDHGFQKGYLDIEEMSIAAVKKYMKEYGAKQVTITGHSLGAAIAVLFGVKLESLLGKGSVKYVLGFGLPRLGNQVFADYVDETLGGRLYYAVNGDDIVARLPPRAFGYQHPSGQIWISPANSDQWVYCPGQENTHCSLSVIPNPIPLLNHVGTYFHTIVGWGPLPCPPKVGDVSNIP